MRKTRSIAFALLLLAGCSSSSSSTTGSDGGAATKGGDAFNGTLGGQSLSVADGFFYPETPSTQSDGGVLNGYQIRLTNYANACSIYLGSSEKSGATYVKLKIRSQGASVTTGTYPVFSSGPPSGNYAEVEVKVLDATCSGSKDEATGGTVNVTTLTSTEIAGTFNVTSGSDTATGSFDVSNCTSGDGGSTSGCAP